MYKIRLVWVGKTQESYLKEGIQLYLKKLHPYVKVECLEVKPTDYTQGSLEHWKSTETQRLLKVLPVDETAVFLDERGPAWTSAQLAQWLEAQKRTQLSAINFCIGGAYGWDQALLPRNAQLLSLSPMTFNHQMVRLFLLEQLYRGFTILRGEPYHH